MSGLQGYVDRRVLLILQDGRAIVGVMAGFDQKSNVVLSDSKERVYSMDEGVEEIPLGLYLVKGDMIVLIGEIDDAVDQAVDLSTIHAEPIPPIRYWEEQSITDGLVRGGWDLVEARSAFNQHKIKIHTSPAPITTIESRMIAVICTSKDGILLSLARFLASSW